MKILVDGTPLLRRKSGVGYYIGRLLEATLELDQVNRYTIYGFAARLPQPRPLEAENVRYRLGRLLPRTAFTFMHRKLRCAPPVDLIARTRPDLVFFTNFSLYPLLRRAKTIVVVHDVAFLHYPQFVTNRHRQFLLRFVPRSLERASAVMANSEFTKQELQRFYGVDAERITVVPCAVDRTRFHPANTATMDLLRETYGLPQGYLLFVGTLEPRKNIVGLLEAYAALPADLKRDHALVIAGGRGWQDAEITRTLRDLMAAGEPIRQLGYIDERDLPAVYSGADALVFPSFYEGFGLPILEAMACGTPVITSNTSSMTEVAGDAALLIDPNDRDSMTQAMKRVLEDRHLADRLRDLGHQRVAQFSWDTSARLLLDLFEKLGRA